MKKISTALLTMFMLIQAVNSQTVTETGKPILEIFADLHKYWNDTTKTSGFGITRAHFGYNYQASENFSAEIILNIGTPEELADGSTQRRYAYFKEAAIAYTRDKLTVNFGMVYTRIFNFQQKFWSKRYVAAEFQSLYGYGSVADLGMVIDYQVNDILKVDFSLLNGKGYSNIQYDNSLKTAYGVTLTPGQFSIRLYGDLMKPLGVMQTTLIGFAGYRNNLFSFGAEISYKSNLDLIEGHDAWGFSATGSIFTGKKSEIFMRYDYGASSVDPEEGIQWDYDSDGTKIIGGFQYTFNKFVRVAIDYRRDNPYTPGWENKSALFLNAHFKF